MPRLDGADSHRGKLMRMYFASRWLGVVFIEYHTARRAAPPFYAHRSNGGEHLLWLGRLHVIYTPARIVFAAAAPASAPSRLF